MNQLEYILRRISAYFHKNNSLLKDFMKASVLAPAFYSLESIALRKVFPWRGYELLQKLEIRASGFFKRVVKLAYDMMSK